VKELLKLTAHELIAKYKAKELKPEELFTMQLRFARHIEPLLGSFLSMAQPDSEITKVTAGERGLTGIPIAVKDNITTRSFPTTAGSRILGGYRPPYDATAVKRLFESGNRIVGKTNMDEFGMGGSTEYSGYHLTRNPWDSSRVPGGSSGGSAAAVAALQSVVALGSDTGGSVRQPASFCGVVGFLPSYGFISRYGLIAFASSLDQIGLFARDVQDIALAMNTISLPDPMDATCQAPAGCDYAAALASSKELANCRIGVVSQMTDEKIINAEVLGVCKGALKSLEQAGCNITQIDIPLIDMLLPCYYILSPAECSSNLARYDGIRYGLGYPAASSEILHEHLLSVRGRGFGEEVKRRILSGTYVLSAGYAEEYYNRARMVRAQVASAVAGLFKDFDFLIAPTAPIVAFKFGEKTADPVTMYAADICTVLASLCSIPAISLPAGFNSDGMPIGIQLIGPRLGDARLLAFAHLFEQVSGQGYRIPPMVSEALARFEG
jgi:aspartyl-tRNA(Asn)/glutamyl-tRNA(Gln) amidotransferase subunit A